MPEYLDGNADFYSEPGEAYMNDPAVINSVNGVPTVAALIRRIEQQQDEEYWS
jgi:hypothetical protein